MKKFYLFSVFALISFFVGAQSQPFITTWKVEPGDLNITIPTIGTGYNYTVDFGDGTVQNNVTGDATHSYSSAGTYTVSISGTFPRIYFWSSLSSNKIQSVEQWGDIQWSSMQLAFSDCINLKINAIDAPDLSQVTDMGGMFASAATFNQSINHWNVGNITNMAGVFSSAISFDQSLDNWDVSSVTNMSSMFDGAQSFNQPLNNWDVSSVTNMSRMFDTAQSFNQPLNNWDVSSVTNMNMMFMYTSFNQPLDNWNVSNVTDMSRMFSWADFNENINTWDVSSVTNMYYLFSPTQSFNRPLNNWDVSNVTNMHGMFDNAVAFNQPLNNWNVSNVTNMLRMFCGATSFNQPLDNWNVSNVVNMESIFDDAVFFNGSVNNWDVSSVTNMRKAFDNAPAFNQPLNNWDVSNVIDMREMFNGAISFNQPLNNWDVSNVTNMYGMFENAQAFNQNLTDWNINTGALLSFLSYSGMNITNYDAFLYHLAALGRNNGSLSAYGLEYCNQAARNELINDLGWNIYDEGLSPYCNTITGNVAYDQSSDGCSTNDIGVNNFMLKANDGIEDWVAFSNNGTYNMGIIGTSFTLSVLNYPNYYTIIPATVTVTFTTSNTAQQDFCVTATQNIEDLNVSLLPTSQARPGFEADYRVVVENIGTQTMTNASVTLSFDDTKQSFTSALPSPNATTSNQLTFDMANLLPFEKRTVNIVMQTFTPPTVNGDDILNFTAIVAPNTNDHTPNDNTFNLAQTVVNSFDPNDKQVLQGDEISLSQADEYLDYLIRFQNTGTASAINVRILDTLHPKLDYSTIKPVSSSHAYRVEITDENQVEFIFENINLPHESADEPGSHGFVAYKIKPKSNVQIGDFITGDARIYFDFNAPIITNMVSTEIVNLGVNESSVLANKIIVFPNPANDKLNIHLTDGIVLEEVKILNIQGQELISVQGKRESIDVEKLASGIYFIKIKTNRGTLNQQVIKN